MGWQWSVLVCSIRDVLSSSQTFYCGRVAFHRLHLSTCKIPIKWEFSKFRNRWFHCDTGLTEFIWIDGLWTTRRHYVCVVCSCSSLKLRLSKDVLNVLGLRKVETRFDLLTYAVCAHTHRHSAALRHRWRGQSRDQCDWWLDSQRDLQRAQFSIC